MNDLISRQAAIDAADRADYRGLTVEDVKKVTDEVVKELKQLPSAQPDVPDTNVGDMVSRQAAFDIINVYAEPIQGYIGTPNDSEVYAYARGLLLSIERNIRALPSAQPDGEYISQQAVTESDLMTP